MLAMQVNNMCIQGTWADALNHSSSCRYIKSYYTKLLFVENVFITYNKDTLIVSKINHTFPWLCLDIELSICTISTSSKSNISRKRTIIFTKVC